MNAIKHIDPLLSGKIHVFKDRYHAGRLLANMLQQYANRKDVMVLAIPAGGIPVGLEVSKNLSVPFDIILVRKIQIPWNKEAGFGALTLNGEIVLNNILIKSLGLTETDLKEAVSNARRTLLVRSKKFGGDRSKIILEDKIVILVDDGLASGYTMLAAVKAVKKKKPKRIIVAVPTAAEEALQLLHREVDEIFCLNLRGGFLFAVADAYKHWRDLTDEEVVNLLRKRDL